MTAGAMDLEDQWKVLQLIEEFTPENIIVFLGCPDAESTQIQAETLLNGDSSMVGPLSDIGYKICVYHVIEMCVCQNLLKTVYDKYIKKYANKLDAESIQERMESVRCQSLNSQIHGKSRMRECNTNV
jgi:glycine/sarcosine/betaine reductase complex component A